jgi:hypothetical protein
MQEAPALDVGPTALVLGVVMKLNVPAVGGHVDDAIASCTKQRGEVEGVTHAARQTASGADDSDREGRGGHLGSVLGLLDFSSGAPSE